MRFFLISDNSDAMNGLRLAGSVQLAGNFPLGLLVDSGAGGLAFRADGLQKALGAGI